MYHLQRSCGFASEREDFSKAVDAGSYVNVDGSLRPSRDREHTNQLFARCGRRVGKSSANADRTFPQTSLDTFDYFANLRRRRLAICSAIDGHPVTGVSHHRHSDLDVADADAVVDSLTRAPLAIPSVNIRRSQLELQRRRHSIKRLHPISLVRRSVRMHVNEPGCDDEAARIDCLTSFYRLRRDSDDSSVIQRDVPDRIEIRFRVDNASAEYDAVVGDHPTGARKRRQTGLGRSSR